MQLIQSLITSSSQAQTRSSQPYSRIVINKTVYFTVNFKERRTLTELKFSYHNSAAFVGLDPQVEVFLITHNDTLQSVGLLWTRDRSVAETSTWTHTQHPQETDTHAPGGIRTCNPSKRTAADPRLRPFGRWDWQSNVYSHNRKKKVRLKDSNHIHNLYHIARTAVATVRFSKSTN